jgi:hypothetical protein
MPYRLYYKIPDQFIAVDFDDSTPATDRMSVFIRKLRANSLPYILFEKRIKADTWQPHRLSYRDEVIYEAIRNETKIRCIQLVMRDSTEFIA